MNFRIGLGLSLLVALAGCSATCPSPPTQEVIPKTRVVDTSCDWAKPIYLDKADVLSDATANAILAHDKAGAAHCNWKPLK
ncbi:hypothetical protein B0G83_10485 [Paraburkholderia sp. BL21I4N1]|nr:hypothetical protein B0G83_10485 [Paraburkholderia sp. BL21I4N1]